MIAIFWNLDKWDLLSNYHYIFIPSVQNMLTNSIILMSLLLLLLIIFLSDLLNLTSHFSSANCIAKVLTIWTEHLSSSFFCIITWSEIADQIWLFQFCSNKFCILFDRILLVDEWFSFWNFFLREFMYIKSWKLLKRNHFIWKIEQQSENVFQGEIGVLIQYLNYSQCS